MACCPSISLPLQAAVISLRLCFSCSPWTCVSISLWLPSLAREKNWGSPFEGTLLCWFACAQPAPLPHRPFFQLPVEQLVETL